MAATTRRPLVAGNWKMNGLTASLAELDLIVAGGAAARLQARPHGVPAGDPGGGVRGPRRRRPGRDRRPGLPRRGGRRLYGRHLGRDAQGRRRLRRHRRPFRAADLSPRKRRRCARQGARRPARRPCWRSSASARAGTSGSPASTLDVVGAQLDGLAARRRDGRKPWSSPTSRSGRSAAGSPRPRPTWPRCMASSGRKLVKRFGAAGQGMRILYGGSVKPANAAS